MSKRLTLIFDEQAWIAAVRGNDPLTKTLAELVGEFGDDKVANALEALLRRLWQPEKTPRKQGGRPPKWGDGKKLYAWLAVEGQWRADKQKRPECKLEDSIRGKFARLPRRSNGAWRVLHDSGARLVAEFPKNVDGRPVIDALGPDVRFVRGPEGGQHLDLANVETARKYHRAGGALLADMRPDVRVRWGQLADQVARSITAKAGTKPTRK
jgi:hypothetical protein